MSHKHGRFQQSAYRTREGLPGMRQTPNGAQILCPFCKPTHPLIPGQPATCGTVLKLTAIQSIVPSRVVRIQRIKCLKCHESGGEMVQYGTGFVHLNDCNPQTRLLPAIPDYNLTAKLVFKLPKGIRSTVEKLTGHAQQVREIDKDGAETGKVLGYFFMGSKEMANG